MSITRISFQRRHTVCVDTMTATSPLLQATLNVLCGTQKIILSDNRPGSILSISPDSPVTVTHKWVDDDSYSCRWLSTQPWLSRRSRTTVSIHLLTVEYMSCHITIITWLSICLQVKEFNLLAVYRGSRRYHARSNDRLPRHWFIHKYNLQRHVSYIKHAVLLYILFVESLPCHGRRSP